jgi:hypothetical protein
VTAPDVDEAPVVADSDLRHCGRPPGSRTWQISRTTRRTFTHAELRAMDARVAFSELAWWQQWLRRKPAGWRSR